MKVVSIMIVLAALTVGVLGASALGVRKSVAKLTAEVEAHLRADVDTSSRVS